MWFLHFEEVIDLSWPLQNRPSIALLVGWFINKKQKKLSLPLTWWSILWERRSLISWNGFDKWKGRYGEGGPSTTRCNHKDRCKNTKTSEVVRKSRKHFSSSFSCSIKALFLFVKVCFDIWREEKIFISFPLIILWLWKVTTMKSWLVAKLTFSFLSTKHFMPLEFRK